MPPLRLQTPKRTYSGKAKTNYRSYKKELRDDFNKRCGYCDDSDFLCGGRRGFHIDHFKPKSKFEHLENDYGNLVYSCPYCNWAKSDDWPSDDEKQNVIGDKGYVDPCDSDYERHFERHANGRIRPKTELGKYMFKKLKLGLRRHQLAWIRDCLDKLLEELSGCLDGMEKENPIQSELANRHLELYKTYRHYRSMFEETI